MSLVTSPGRLLAIALCLLFIGIQAVSARWLATEQIGSVVHLVNPTYDQVQRYDIVAATWLPPVELPKTHGSLTSAAVDADGIFLAYDHAVFRYALDGTGETAVANVQNRISALFTDGDLLLICHPEGLYGRATSVKKTTNAIIDFHETYPVANYGASISRTANRIVGTSQGISPASLSYIDYGDDGVFTQDGSGSAKQGFVGGTRTWFDEEGGRIIDDRGNVFDGSTLVSTGNIERIPSAVTFISGKTVINDNGYLTLFDSNLQVIGEVLQNTVPVDEMVATDQEILTFGVWESISHISLADFPGVPVTAVNPVKSAYTVDDAVVTNSGEVYLFSQSRACLYRWDPESLAYTGVIPLQKNVRKIAYIAAADTIYTGYDSGLIRRVQLDTKTPFEVPFAQIQSSPASLVAAGPDLHVLSRSSNDQAEYLFASDGTLRYRWTNNRYSSGAIWNAARERIFYYQQPEYRDIRVMSRRLDSAHDTSAVMSENLVDRLPTYDPNVRNHFIRPSDSGAAIASTIGVFLDGTTLATSANQYSSGIAKDAAWTSVGFHSIHEDRDIQYASEITRVVTSDPTTLAPVKSVKFPGKPVLLRNLSDGRLLLITLPIGGIPSLRILEGNLDVASPQTLTPPPIIPASSSNWDRNYLAWGDVQGAASFRVERRTLPDGQWTALGNGVSSFYRYDSWVSYAYRVIAVNGSISSEPAYFDEPSSGAPDAPVLSGNLTSNTTATFSWSANGSAQYKLYYAYYTDRPDARWQWFQQPPAGTQALNVSNLRPGSRIYFYLVATNEFGSSPFSEPFAILTPPASSNLLSPDAQPDRVILRWDEPYQTGTDRTYLVERSTGEDGPWETLAEPVFLYHEDRTVETGVSYRYRITTRNESGQAISNVQQVVIPPLPLPEISISYQTLRHGPNSSTLIKWYPGRYETAYRIERRTDTSDWAGIATIPEKNDLSDLEYEDLEVVPDTVYWYRVVYLNQTGETPAPEMRNRAAAVAVLATEDFEPGIDEMLWADTADAELVTDTSNPTNHVLRLSGGGDKKITLKPLDTSSGGWIRLRGRMVGEAPESENESQPSLMITGQDSRGYNVPGGFIFATDQPPSEWRTYFFEFSESSTSSTSGISFLSISSTANDWEIDDIEISAAVPQTIPQPVDGTSIATLAMGWTPVSIEWNRSTDANGYSIERRSADTPWTIIGTHYADELLFGNRPNFNDVTALNGTTYFYRIIARNPAGDAPPSSEFTFTTVAAKEQWLNFNYSTSTPTGTAAWLEDNGTGTVNLLKYAFNLPVREPLFSDDPNEVRGMPASEVDPITGLLRLRFVRYKSEWNPGINYIVEFSEDAVTWSTAGHQLEATPSASRYQWITWQDDLPASGQIRPKRFCRVRVVEQ